MKVAWAVVLSIVLCAGWVKPSWAAHPHGATVQTTFRLQVQGHVGPHTTFWVAYGPLADHWGIVRLHAAGHGMFVARRRLPLHGRSVFAYLVGNGTITTRIGPVPGNPVITIRRLGPLTISARGLPLVHWTAPVG